MELSIRPENLSCSQKYGFTLVEIMIVVAIIAIVATIAIPNYLRGGRRAQRNACVANLRTLEGAIEQVRLEGGAEVVTMDVLCEPGGYIKTEPRCPADSSEAYEISGVMPLCPNRERFPEHTIGQ